WARQAYRLVHNQLRTADDLQLPGDASVELRIRVTPVAANPAARRISVFLINVAPPHPPGESAPTPDLGFQPQIRRRRGQDSRLWALPRHTPAPEPEPAADWAQHEEPALDLLYLDQPVLARGHMCAAVWQEIDPERTAPGDGPNPFAWVDEEVVPVV